MYHSSSSFARAPFAEQLGELTQMDLPGYKDIPTETTSSNSKQAVESVDNATSQVLNYFQTGRSVLNDLDAQDDVEWMFEGRQATLDVGKTIMRAGDVMNQLMTVLENSRSNDEGGECSEELYLPVVEKIEQAITEWHDILGVIRDLRCQIDIATEWKEFYDQIMTEVEQEIDSCFTVIFEIEEKRHFASSENPDLDVLTSVMDESPFLGHPKLPSLDDKERDLNQKFIEVKTRLKPLRASLDFLPLRLEQYSMKAKNLFPSSVELLNSKYKEMKVRWDALNTDISTLEKELGEDRWLEIFRNTGKQAEEMLDNYDGNKKIIQQEMSKFNNGGDQNIIYRYQTQNAYLVPAISRIVALFDRALKDRLTVNGEMFNKQAKLHKRWEMLEQPVIIDSSPLANKLEDNYSSSTTASSTRSSFSSTITSSPYSSLHSSPNLSSTVKPINSKLKPGNNKEVNNRSKRSRTSLEGCVEINPLRGFSRPNSISSNSSSSNTSQGTATTANTNTNTNTTIPENNNKIKKPTPPSFASRLSLLPVPKESPRPMHHIQPPSIIYENEPPTKRRNSMIPRPSSRLGGAYSQSQSHPQSQTPRRCHTPLGFNRRVSSVYSSSSIYYNNTTTSGLETPRSKTPKPRCSSRLDDDISKLPRPSSQLTNITNTPSRKNSFYSTTPLTRKTSVPMSLNKRDSMSSLSSMMHTPSRRPSGQNLVPPLSSSKSTVKRPGTTIGMYNNRRI